MQIRTHKLIIMITLTPQLQQIAVLYSRQHASVDTLTTITIHAIISIQLSCEQLSCKFSLGWDGGHALCISKHLLVVRILVGCVDKTAAFTSPWQLIPLARTLARKLMAF